MIGKRHVYQAGQNKRRDSYDVEQRSSLLPVVVAATVAAVVMHGLMYLSIPYLVQWRILDIPDRVEPDEEVVRIIVAEREEEKLIVEDLPFEQEEMMEPKIDTEEIDLMDMEFEELIMAPGETNLAVAEPEPQDDRSLLESMPINTQDVAMPLAPLPPVELESVEPAPINTNDVVANIPSSEDVSEAEASIHDQLISDAGKGDGLREDSRSLSELMQLSNPGAASGVARLGADVLFSFGEAKLLNASRLTMIQLAALISKNPKTRFVIEGHTDSYGSAEINDILSLMRAASVRAWLEDNGIATKNVYLRACGSKNPLVSTKGSREEQKVNRRVEIHMRKAKETLPEDCYSSEYRIDLTKSAATHLKEQKAKAEKEAKAKADAAAKAKRVKP